MGGINHQKWGGKHGNVWTTLTIIIWWIITIYEQRIQLPTVVCFGTTFLNPKVMLKSVPPGHLMIYYIICSCNFMQFPGLHRFTNFSASFLGVLSADPGRRKGERARSSSSISSSRSSSSSTRVVAAGLAHQQEEELAAVAATAAQQRQKPRHEPLASEANKS